MSLLMDALKRAEQAREARERDGQSAEAAPTRRSAIPELSLDPVDLNSINSALTLEPVGAESTLELTIGDPGVPDDSATGINMLKLPENTPEPGESSDGLSFRLSAEGTLNSEDPLAALEDSYAARENSIGRIEESPTRSEDSVDPLSMALGAQDIEVQDTSATLPSLKAVRASVNSYFDGTDSVSISMESVPPELVSANTSTTITGRRLGEEVEAAQKAAQRVFDSKLPPSPSTGRTGRTLAFVILPIVLVLLGTAGVFIWVTNASAPSVAVRADGGSPSLMDTLLSFIDPAPVQFSPRRPTPTGYPVASAPALTVAAVPADASLGRQAVGGRPEPSNAELVRRANQALADGTATIAARGPGSELIPGMPVPEQA
ncbi:MAG: hypothetical protein HOI95_03395, partial [Chromatiales bacterium]|nr:hypothetical protein [Chromatiales bacterium]